MLIQFSVSKPASSDSFQNFSVSSSPKLAMRLLTCLCILIPFIFFCICSSFFKGHSFEICPGFFQRKHFPSCINFFRSSKLMESISIVFGSPSFLGKNCQFDVPVFGWFCCVLPMILCILLYWWLSFVAHLYQSSNFFGGFSKVMIHCCNGNPSVSRKMSMITGDDLLSLDSDTNILNFAMCSSIKSSFRLLHL